MHGILKVFAHVTATTGTVSSQNLLVLDNSTWRCQIIQYSKVYPLDAWQGLIVTENSCCLYRMMPVILFTHKNVINSLDAIMLFTTMSHSFHRSIIAYDHVLVIHNHLKKVISPMPSFQRSSPLLSRELLIIVNRSRRLFVQAIDKDEEIETQITMVRHQDQNCKLNNASRQNL